MGTTTAFKTKKYVADQLNTLLTNYEELVVVTYGPTTQDLYSSTIEVLGVSWESTENHSTGSTRMTTLETYKIKCVVAVAQKDGTSEDVERSVHEIYSVIENFIRDDLMATKLGANVSFAKCLPTSIQPATLPDGGAAAYMEFDIECTAKVR